MAPFSIDANSYNKAAHYPQRHGYQLRGGARPLSVVIHTTSNGRPTQFETEASFLFKSAAVSAHFLISKTGEIIEFLDPLKFQAWHAGNALPAFLNVRSVGIEHHVSVGETWTPVQHEACTWLVRYLMDLYAIPAQMVETHRAVALPKGRKRDPEGWTDEAFYAWRAQLTGTPPAPATPRYQIIAPCTVLTDRRPDAPLAPGPNDGQTRLAPPMVVNVGDVKDGWLWVSPNDATPPGIGFIPAAYARKL